MDHGCIRPCKRYFLQLNIILSPVEYLHMISYCMQGPSGAVQHVENYISLQQNGTGNVKWISGLLC